jgi:hypothetical protein
LTYWGIKQNDGLGYARQLSGQLTGGNKEGSFVLTMIYAIKPIIIKKIELRGHSNVSLKMI